MPPLPTLPVELLTRISESLELGGVKNLRLASKSFATIGADSLFKDGSFFVSPHRDGTERLRKVANVPLLASKLRHLEFNMRYVLGGSPSGFFYEYIKILDYLGLELDAVDKLSEVTTGQMKNAFGDDEMLSHCDIGILQESFSLLTNIHSITATSWRITVKQDLADKYGFYENGIIPKIFERWERDEEPAYTIVHFSNLLFAAATLSTPIQKLDIDSLPIETFMRFPEGATMIDQRVLSDHNLEIGVDIPKLTAFKKAVAHVRDLRLVIKQPQKLPGLLESKLYEALGEFIKALTHLQCLDLSWKLNTDLELSFSKKFQDILIQGHWPKLESLSMVWMYIKWEPFQPFLSQHASTLKHLQTGPIVSKLRQRPDVSYRTILTILKDSLNLETFRLRGTCQMHTYMPKDET